MKIMNKLIPLLKPLIILPITITILNQNCVYCEIKNAKTWIERISFVDLTTGIGKTISNAIDNNIRAKAETLGEKGKDYWAWRAINKELIAKKDFVALKWRSSIEYLKKMVVSVFYRSEKFAYLNDFYGDTLQHISGVINNCYLKKIDWYNDFNTKQKIFGLLNGVFVLLLLDENVRCVSNNNVYKYSSVTKMFDKEHPQYKNGIFGKIRSVMQNIKIKSDSRRTRTLFEEILLQFNNDEKKFKDYFTHDVRCYLEQFNVVARRDITSDNTNVTCDSVIEQYVRTCYLKEKWMQKVANDNFTHKYPQLLLLHKPASNHKVLSNWLNDECQHEVYKVCNEGIDIWLSQKIPNLENIINRYNECIKHSWHSEFKHYVKIDYDDYDFLMFISELTKYDTKNDAQYEIFSERACGFLAGCLLQGIHTWETDTQMVLHTPLLGCDNVRHLRPIDILRLTTHSYSYLQSCVMNKMHQNKRYSNLQNNVLSKCNLIINDTFEYIVFKKLTNVNVDSVIKLIRFLINKKMDDIIYDLDEHGFGPHGRELKIYSWQSILESLIDKSCGLEEKDFSKIVERVIKLK